MNSSAKQTFPRRARYRTWLFFLSDRFLRERLENRPETAASGPEYAVNGLPYARRKADAAKRAWTRRNWPLVERLKHPLFHPRWPPLTFR
jgi:hypothetical protein